MSDGRGVWPKGELRDRRRGPLQRPPQLHGGLHEVPQHPQREGAARIHLHNHQWLFNPNDDNSNYIDAQGIGPGMGYTYEMAHAGSGNRNKSGGDAIYPCHFYPHFAQGMWYMWRIHDVFESGTKLDVSGADFHTAEFALKDGTPAPGARALPDGELTVGVPIPAVVPLPGKGLAPIPAEGVTVQAFDRNGAAPGGTSSLAE